MDYEQATKMLKYRARRVGLQTSGVRVTFYGFRRYNLNKVLRRAGIDATRRHAAHQAGSKTLMDTYYDPTNAIDLVGIVGDEEEEFDLGPGKTLEAIV